MLKALLITYALIGFFNPFSLKASNDIIVNVQVIPPYAPYLSTYADQPNKLMVSFQNLTNQTKNIKLMVRIEGDNGVSGITTSDFSPSLPIILGPNQFKQLDFSDPETRNYLSEQHLSWTGITRSQLLQNQVLPEGNYTICVQVLDYTTGLPLSADFPSGCSASFPVYYIDPPEPLQPTCGSTVTATTPQNIIFSWMPPAMASGNIQYELTIKEIPNSLNAASVFGNKAIPILFKTTIMGTNTFVYTNALPALESGKKYVWKVQAKDPNNILQFKNNGFCKTCWFNYKIADIQNTVTPVSHQPNKLTLGTSNEADSSSTKKEVDK